MGESRGGRLVSLDVFRGAIMLTLASTAFGLNAAAKHFPDNETWRLVAFHTDHPEWISNHWVAGVSYWDLIQPAFMFMVGVSMPFSYARRLDRGQGFSRMAGHALFRSVVLVLLGVFLSSAWNKHTDWSFVNVLTQIGLGYFVVFLLMHVRPLFQVSAAMLILFGYWLAFVIHVVPNSAGMADHFRPGVNFAEWFDTWFLNKFPRDKPFTMNEGHYATLNFVPSIVTMLFGLMCGELLRSQRPGWAKVGLLLGGALVCMALGLAGGQTICPIVKRIWTPSWVLFSGAYVMGILALLYLVIDVIGLKFWTWPLVVLGTNSILLYVLAQLTKKWVASQLLIHFGGVDFHFTLRGVEHHFNYAHQMTASPYGPIWYYSSVMAVFWLLCAWLHRQKLFVRI
ncbi:MAG: acyltransferase family protein [Gemmataceae bacterium]